MSQLKKSSTTINENARKSMGITRDEYALCSYALYRCADPRMKLVGWCTDTKDDVADFVGITRPGLYKMIARLEQSGLLETQAGTGFFRATAQFIDIQNGTESKENAKQDCKQSLQQENGSVNKVYSECKQSLQDSVNLVTGNIEVQYDISMNKVNSEADLKPLPKNKKKENEKTAAAAEILAHLNEKAGRSFNAEKEQTLKPIIACLNEKMTVEDAKRVIAYKCVRWLNDPKMKEYLRPQTLFGTNFWTYLEEATPKKPKPQPQSEGQSATSGAIIKNGIEWF
jgi:uncharacterized phage protein (TIGR02220 family)